jgi:hypothetical protein
LVSGRTRRLFDLVADRKASIAVNLARGGAKRLPVRILPAAAAAVTLAGASYIMDDVFNKNDMFSFFLTGFLMAHLKAVEFKPQLT